MNTYEIHQNYVKGFISSKRHGHFEFIIDNDIYEKIKPYNWSIAPRPSIKSGFYIQNRELGLLHRFIMGYPENMCVDHVNRNTFDNRRINLRVCTKGKNNSNRAAYSKSGYKYMYVNYRTNRKSKMSYSIKFPGLERKQTIDKKEAEAYYIECLLATDRKVN